MPKSADMLLLVIGAVLLAAGLFGGGTKIFSVEVPIGFGGRVARVVAMSMGTILIGAGLYLAIIRPLPSNVEPARESMGGQASKAFCLAIKSQWEIKHSWSSNDDEALRQSFRHHGCQTHGITLP